MDHFREGVFFILAVAVVQFLDGLIFGAQVPVPTVIGARFREVVCGYFRRR